MRKTVLAAVGIACGFGFAPSYAQNLQMVEPPPAQARVETPSRGLSMAQVQARFGEPAKRYPAVGDPPITRWVYPAFVVYFEHNLVVHAVAQRMVSTPR